MIRKLLLASLFCLPAWAGEPVVVNSGDTRTAVVELYTSEGCSSCPPADRWLSRLVEIPKDELDVLALSFHVDYWDYLGWKDRFASAEYSKRQRALGANNQQRTIYTPEFFVDGMEARGAKNILGKIQQANLQPAPLSLELTVSRDQTGLLLDLHSPGERNIADQIRLRYLVYENNLSTDVRRGENSGSILHHQRVVRYMSPARNLQVDNHYRIPINPEWKPENLGVAVLVTSPGDRHYLQALHTPVASLLTSR
ncbi:MAG: DUF1223 domain-containing protein [Gammaproteobacteria bacterium]|nr:MAG: DUF1223 domain-containing protein [Gammaproteobacteria bacterium]UCH39422.1 MAG: DUF1223 domain-containing protein [Gammaproteobacteria bacterium]